MKQILIKHADDITDVEALRHAFSAFRQCEDRRGVVAFVDDVALVFSDRSKHPTVTIFKEKRRK